eukprot:5496422-Ditylum_brightwellii.AAC.1
MPNGRAQHELDKSEMAQQPTYGTSFPAGLTVKWKDGKKTKLATVIHSNEGDKENPACTIQVLSTPDEITVPATNLEACTSPDPADIPLVDSDIDPNAMNTIVSMEDITQLWHKDQVTLTPELRLYLYWHQRLQHPSHVSMVRLAQQGVLPSAIKHIKKAPPCTVCIFAKAQKRAWRNRWSGKKNIRKKHHTTPGSGTSMDHIVSHQPGLIPQVTGRLTND